MNKFILGSILAAISLMAIYGSSASNRVTSWVDGDNRTTTQSNFGQTKGETNNQRSPEQLIALNETDSDPFIQISSRTPLEKAGDIPQRQTRGVQSSPAFGTNAQSANAGDDTDGGVVNPNPAPAQNTPPAQPAPGASQGQSQPQTQPQPPVRALW